MSKYFSVNERMHTYLHVHKFSTSSNCQAVKRIKSESGLVKLELGLSKRSILYHSLALACCLYAYHNYVRTVLCAYSQICTYICFFVELINYQFLVNSFTSFLLSLSLCAFVFVFFLNYNFVKKSQFGIVQWRFKLSHNTDIHTYISLHGVARKRAHKCSYCECAFQLQANQPTGQSSDQ